MGWYNVIMCVVCECTGDELRLGVYFVDRGKKQKNLFRGEKGETLPTGGVSGGGV